MFLLFGTGEKGKKIEFSFHFFSWIQSDERK